MDDGGLRLEHERPSNAEHTRQRQSGLGLDKIHLASGGTGVDWDRRAGAGGGSAVVGASGWGFGCDIGWGGGIGRGWDVGRGGGIGRRRRDGVDSDGGAAFIVAVAATGRICGCAFGANWICGVGVCDGTVAVGTVSAEFVGNMNVGRACA
jgi:hypothetical protein